MNSVRELLEGLSLPAPAAGAAPEYALPSAHLLSAELPQGHLHVWSGPPGAGKTAFLLGLLREAARRGRGALLATYDLSAPALALRMLAMDSGVPLDALDGGRLTPAEEVAVARSRARLATLPLHVMEARGLSVASIEDRIARQPVPFDTLGIDFVEAVVRRPEQPVAATFRALSDLARRGWLAVVAVARTSPVEHLAPEQADAADRVGWIAPAADAEEVREASLLANRHGGLHRCRMRLDPGAVRFEAEADPAAGGPEARA